MKCTATNGRFVCELERGHTTRHNAAGAEPWLDQSVLDARALARQNKEKTEGEPLAKLLACLENVASSVNWQTDEHQKALWLEMILDRYRATEKVLK